MEASARRSFFARPLVVLRQVRRTMMPLRTTHAASAASIAPSWHTDCLRHSLRESSVQVWHRTTSARLGMASALLASFGFKKPSWLPKFSSGDIDEVKDSESSSVLGRARSARRGCSLAPASPPEGLGVATFAGGCFWGLQLAVDRVPGVMQTTVGYTGGRDSNPTYDAVCSGRTGHAEAVQAYFDPNVTTYEKILDCFFAKVDPTTRNRQGGDVGSQYRSAIYFHSPEQELAAQRKIEEVNQGLSQNAFRRVLGSKVVTELQPAADYYIAEGYHQKYLQKGGRFGAPQSAEKGCTDKIR